jgi:hypothetical protein
MKGHIKLSVVVVLGLSIIACTTTGAPETPTNVPDTDTPTPTDKPTSTLTRVPTVTATATVEPTAEIETESVEDCDPNQVIADLYTEFTREQFTFVYSGSFIFGAGTVSRLTFWMVDYSVNPDPGTNPNVILNNAGTALESGLHAASYIEHNYTCVNDVFAYINPIVVDRNYAGWISIDLPTGVLAENVDLTDSQQTADLDQYAQLNYVRQDPPAPFGSPSANSCDWSTARTGLEGEFLSNSNGNTAFFFVRDDHGNNVWVYLDNSNVTLTPEDFLEDQVLQIIADIECLHPVPDNLIVQTLGENGTILFSGRLPKAGIESGDVNQFVQFP